MTQPASDNNKHVPYYFVAFFVFIALVNAVMVVLALRTHTGAVTDHPYEKGLAYNLVVEAETAQEKLGWRGEIDYRHGVLRFSLVDEGGNPLSPDTLRATCIRPTQEGLDFEVVMKNGEAHVDFPVRGLWEVRIFATVGDKNYQQSKRIVVE